MKEFLLAESGSTKTHWVQYNHGQEYSFYTGGLNPNHHTDEEFLQKLKTEIDPYPFTGPVYFYGAGCSTTPQQKRVATLLEKHFKLPKIHVHSDLEGACISVSGKKPGIVAISGTGASACRFNGKKVTEQAPSLGYLLGDEGSGASFGKKIVNAYLRNELPARLRQLFEQGFDTKQLIQRIYQHPQPAAFLASYFPFIDSYRNHAYIKNLIKEELTLYINLHILPLKPKKNEPIHFCGSVAWLLQKEISTILKKKKLRCGNFLQHPAPGLIEHLRNQKS